MRLNRSVLPLLAVLGIGAIAGMGAQVPRQSPELSFRFPDGKQDLLSNYRGKVVAVEILSTHCPHCQQSSVIIEKLYKEYGPKGFLPIGVAVNPDAQQQVPDFIKRFGLTFPVAIGDSAAARTYLQHPLGQRFLVPNLVLIDRTGTIQAQYSAGDQGAGDQMFANEEAALRPVIEKLLNQNQTAAKKPAAKTGQKRKSGSARGGA